MKQELINKLTELDNKMKENHANLNLSVVVETIEEFFNQNGSLELNVGGTPIKQEYININK